MEPNENDCCETESTCNGYSFKELFADFVAGTPIKRKSWRGYWKYRFGEIEIHSKDGAIIKLSETKDILFTLAGVLQNDWEYGYDYNCDIPVK